MNAHQRRVVRRSAERAEHAEATIAELRVRVGNLEEQLSRATADLEEITDLAVSVANEVAEREAEITTLVEVLGIRSKRIEVLERTVAVLEAPERDVAKLRRRLQERSMELEAAHRRLHELEAQQRTATASAAPMIDWRRHG